MAQADPPDALSQPQTSRPHIPGYGIPKTMKGILPWSYVTERMEKAHNYWIGTTDPQGKPHATPVWGVWLDGTFFFDGSPKTRRGRNLAKNPNIVVHLENGTEAVILQGQAHEIQGVDKELATRQAAAYGAKYAASGYEPTPDTWDKGGLYRMKIHQAFAWSKFPKDATRFRFSE